MKQEGGLLYEKIFENIANHCRNSFFDFCSADSTLNGKEQIYPEYESVAQLSREKEIPFTEIYRYIVLANKDKE